MDRPIQIVVLISPFLVACAEDQRTPVSFSVELQGNVAPFETVTGWEVTLDEAVVSMGPVRLVHEPEEDESLPHTPEFVPALGLALARLLIPVAHAHGGAGDGLDLELVGEIDEQVAYSLLGGPSEALEGRGYEESVNTYEVILEPASALTLGDGLAVADSPIFVSGTATRGGESIEFVGEFPHSDPGSEAEEGTHGTGEQTVEHFLLEEGGVVILRIDPAMWFARAEFAELTTTDGQGRRVITASSEVGKAWVENQAAAFSLEWRAPD